MIEPSTTAAELPRPPYSFAKRHGVLVAERRDGLVHVIHRADVEIAALSEVQRFIGHPLSLQAVNPAEFDVLIARHYDSGSETTSEMMDNIGEELDLDRVAETMPEPEDLLESQDDAPIIRLINALLTRAIKENASDIHIEAFENQLVVRFRVDGVLREVLKPPRTMGPLIASRIKVMARLDIAEKRLPQDGRISLKIAGRAVDVRVSTLPSGHGERVVMRLLDKQAGKLDLGQLGMASEQMVQLDELIRRPHGILLVTGPTGSGKTTTLYAALSRINDRKRNILTVEDPIEYFIEGIGQTQVNPKVDMTFARGLRAILRQDPDVVMVGEIRDLETAQIAVQSSLTGHMVFSTLHTNTAIGAIARLRDMGVEPFLLASSLVGVLAQRLVRLLCPQCKQERQADAAECEMMGTPADPPPTVWNAIGCPACNHSGYQGRTGIYELVMLDERLRSMIHDNSSEQKIEKYVHQNTASIRRDGVRRVLRGETTLEEILRVTRD